MSTVISHDSSREDIEGRLLELRNDFTELPERERRSAEDNERVMGMIGEVEELDKRLTLEDVHTLREERKRQAEEARRNQFNGVATIPGASHEHRGIGEILVASEEFQQWEQRGFQLPPKGQAAAFDLQIPYSFRSLEQRAVAEWTSSGPTNASTGDAAALLPVGQPIAPVPRQARLFLDDLIPHTPTTLSQVPYVRELSPTATEFSASAVSETVTKPDSGVNFQAASAPVTVLAVTMTLTKQIFEDSPAVVGYVQSRLPYFVRFKRQDELLEGSGTWADITGILNTTGILTQTATSGDPAVTIGNAFAKIENQDGSASGVTLNPTNAWEMYTRRTSGSGQLDAGTPFSSLPMTVWGVPTVRSRVQPVDTALVGDFGNGAMIFDREQINLQVYSEVLAASNQVLLVCETRLGLAVFRPDFFCQTTLS